MEKRYASRRTALGYRNAQATSAFLKNTFLVIAYPHRGDSNIGIFCPVLTFMVAQRGTFPTPALFPHAGQKSR